jgi:hypothetical protein
MDRVALGSPAGAGSLGGPLALLTLGQAGHVALPGLPSGTLRSLNLPKFTRQAPQKFTRGQCPWYAPAMATKKSRPKRLGQQADG